MTRPLVCWNCGKALDDMPLPISRHANCPACFEVVHCCRMCIHFVPTQQGQCDHERADPPVTKETGNFCEYFKPSPNAFEPVSKGRSDSAKTQLADLFGGDNDDGDGQDSDKPGPDNDSRSRFDDLFKD
jgi:hypothetical protein